MVVSIKGSGMIILNMEKGIRNLIMELYTQGLMLMENLKDMEHILGKMVKLMKANGLMVWKVGLEFGEGQLVIRTLVNGRMDKLTDTAYIHGSMAIDIKDSLKIA